VPFSQAIGVIAEELGLPKSYLEGLLESIALGRDVVRALGDVSSWVCVEFYHSHIGEGLVLRQKEPDGWRVLPASRRMLFREESSRDK